MTFDKLGRNLERYCTMPRNSWSDLTFVGVGIFMMAAVFSGSAAMPLSVVIMTNERYRGTSEFNLGRI